MHGDDDDTTTVANTAASGNTVLRGGRGIIFVDTKVMGLRSLLQIKDQLKCQTKQLGHANKRATVERPRRPTSTSTVFRSTNQRFEDCVTMALPLLNLKLHHTNPKLFADQLTRACHEIGFFLLEHDIPTSTGFSALSEARQFFSRPIEQKMTISYESDPSFRGYMQIGVENTEGKVDWREQIEYAAEYGWYHRRQHTQADTNSPFYHRLRATSNPWPDIVQPSLRPATMDYVTGVLGVADRLRDAMCLGLNVNANEVRHLFGNITKADDGQYVPSDKNGDVPFWSMKMVSYPPVSADSTDSLQGVGAHADTNFLTLILQDPQSSGLQVQSVQDGKWIDVPPTPSNVLVCNVGELAEIWTKGYFLATPHRVMRQTSNCSRVSLPIFYNPTIDTKMQAMVDIDLLSWTRKQHSQWRRQQNSLINSVGENSFKSLARSHPAVFAKQHSDLMILDDGRMKQI